MQPEVITGQSQSLHRTLNKFLVNKICHADSKQNLLQIQLLKGGEVVQILDKFIPKYPICHMINMDYAMETIWQWKPIFSMLMIHPHYKSC